MLLKPHFIEFHEHSLNKEAHHKAKHSLFYPANIFTITITLIPNLNVHYINDFYLLLK